VITERAFFTLSLLLASGGGRGMLSLHAVSGGGRKMLQVKHTRSQQKRTQIAVKFSPAIGELTHE